MKTFWDICIFSVILYSSKAGFVGHLCIFRGTEYDGWLRASVVSQRDVPAADRGPGGPRGNGINNW